MNRFCPPSSATTFAFFSVFILLLCVHSMYVYSLIYVVCVSVSKCRLSVCLSFTFVPQKVSNIFFFVKHLSFFSHISSFCVFLLYPAYTGSTTGSEVIPTCIRLRPSLPLHIFFSIFIVNNMYKIQDSAHIFDFQKIFIFSLGK